MLELSEHWEVGLQEISFPGKVNNITGTLFTYMLHRSSEESLEVGLYQGVYLTLTTVLREMNAAHRRLTNASAPMISFYILRSNRCVTMKFADKAAELFTGISFSLDLAIVLGFQPYVRYEMSVKDEIIAKRPAHLRALVGNMYVYCDILEHLMVGDTKALLLRIVNRKTNITNQYDTIEHVTFNPIQYVPLQKRCFDTISVQLMTDFGQPMPFVAGKSILVLEFRRMVHPYLSL